MRGAEGGTGGVEGGAGGQAGGKAGGGAGEGAREGAGGGEEGITGERVGEEEVGWKKEERRRQRKEGVGENSE